MVFNINTNANVLMLKLYSIFCVFGSVLICFFYTGRLLYQSFIDQKTHLSMLSTQKHGRSRVNLQDIKIWICAHHDTHVSSIPSPLVIMFFWSALLSKLSSYSEAEDVYVTWCLFFLIWQNQCKHSLINWVQSQYNENTSFWIGQYVKAMRIRSPW